MTATLIVVAAWSAAATTALVGPMAWTAARDCPVDTMSTIATTITGMGTSVTTTTLATEA